MDASGLPPSSSPGSRVDSTVQPHSSGDAPDLSGEYRGQMPRHQATSSVRELSERSIEVPSSAMTSRYTQIRTGIAELADGFRSLRYALSPKESEPLRFFLAHLENSYVETLAQILEELLVTSGLSGTDSENLISRVASVRSLLQEAVKDKEYGFNDAQLLFTKIKDDLAVIAKIFETISTSSLSEKAAVLRALNQIQAVEARIAMLAGSGQDDYQPMVNALKQMQVKLDKVELGLNALNPVGAYGIVSSSAEEIAVALPPCGKPELPRPELCDLQRSVYDLRSRMAALQQELGKDNMKTQTCKHYVSGIISKLTSLAEDAGILEKATLEVQEKARSVISIAQIKNGFNRLSTAGIKGLAAGLSKLLGHGQVWLAGMASCCYGFTWLLSSGASGILWSAKGFGYYAGVALLTPVFIVKKLAVDEAAPLWAPPLPVNDFSDLPEGMEICNPLENIEAFEMMYRSLGGKASFDKDVTPAVKPAQATNPLPPTITNHSGFHFVEELEACEASLQNLETELSSGSMKAVLLADESLTTQKLDAVRLEKEFHQHRHQMPASLSKSCQTTLDSCQTLIASCNSLAPSHSSDSNNSFDSDSSFVPVEESLSMLSSEDDLLHQKIIQSYSQPEKLAALFIQAEDVHIFLQRQMLSLAKKVSPEELKLIGVALEKYKDECLKKEARRFALQAFHRRFHGRFKTEHCGPSMKADPDAVAANIQDGLEKEITQVTRKLKDLLPREQMATEGQDWHHIKEKARFMALLDMMKEYLDNASLLKQNLHYFTGHDLSEKDVEEREVALNTELRNLSNELKPHRSLNRTQLEIAEKRVEEIETELTELKNKLADLYFEGWVDQQHSVFELLEKGRDLVRQLKAQVLRHYEYIVEPDAQIVREKILSELKELSEELKVNLPASGRRADIDQAIALLESDSGHWNKEKWLHLNWMCNQYSSMLRKPLHHYYASVERIAREAGAEINHRLQAEIDAFDLCSTGDIEHAVQSVMNDWERHHNTSIDELLTNPALKQLHESSYDNATLFTIRADVLFSARIACSSASRGVMLPPENLGVVQRFYKEVLTRAAGKHAAFDRAIRTLDPKQYQVALQQVLDRMKEMENGGAPCFPVIKVLAEMDEKASDKPEGCRFDDIVRWAEKKLDHSLDIREREELMLMFIQFRDQLMKQLTASA